MKNINDLQDLIAQKAESKLDENLETLRNYLHNGFAFKLLELDAKVTIGGKEDSLRSALWSTDSLIFKALKEKLLPSYIKNESALFIKKVDEINNQVSELMSYQ